MLAVVNTPGGAAPVAVSEVAEPAPAANEALVAVHRFSLNRGETRLFQVRPEGWRPPVPSTWQDLRGRPADDKNGIDTSDFCQNDISRLSEGGIDAGVVQW